MELRCTERSIERRWLRLTRQRMALANPALVQLEI